MIRVFDIKSGNATDNIITHSTEVLDMDMNQNGMASERKLVFVDSNKDLFMILLHKPDEVPLKICNMVDSFSWNNQNDMLAVLTDGKLKTWFYPNAMYADKELMNKALQIIEANDIGKMGQITQFNGNLVNVRRLDGSLATLSVSPYPKMLYE